MLKNLFFIVSMCWILKINGSKIETIDKFYMLKNSFFIVSMCWIHNFQDKITISNFLSSSI